MLPEPTTGGSKTRNLGFGTPHARRNGRCRGARPIGPWYVRSTRAKRASGLSRAAATCASAQASASCCSLITGSRTALQA
jgi:hypothetical protein